MPLMLRKKDKLAKIAERILGGDIKEDQTNSETNRLKKGNDLERRLASEETSQVKY